MSANVLENPLSVEKLQGHIVMITAVTKQEITNELKEDKISHALEPGSLLPYIPV